MPHEEWTPPGINARVPSTARIYDYILGGKDNYAVDRAVAEQILAVAPDTRRLARCNRAFLVRTVRYLAEHGISQFIDLGAGIPTSPSVHEVARALQPGAPVVYVDNDPVVVAHNRAKLRAGSGVTTVEGDIRRPGEVLADPAVTKLIDFDRPVGVLLVSVLHLLTDHEDPASVVGAFRDLMAPGSHMVISHLWDRSDERAMGTVVESFREGAVEPVFRSVEEIVGWFAGFDLVSPGLVECERWRPEDEPVPTLLKMVGGVGRLCASQ
jgi:hypothetical protein